MCSRIMVVAMVVGLATLAGGMANETRAANADRVLPAPVGHRQPTVRDVPPPSENSAEEAMKKMDQDLDRKVRSICRGC